jgi:predicted AAA+ superfamily ATPase
VVKYHPKDGKILPKSEGNMYNRFLTNNLIKSLEDTPVLIVVGARQVGKSTLLKNMLSIDTVMILDEGPGLSESGSVKYMTLDDLSTLSAAKADPDFFLSQYNNATLVIDEAQLSPELLRTIKKFVDSDRKNGKYILSGSADIMALPTMSESLAGRCEIFYMYPLSQTEVLNHRKNFIDLSFSENFITADNGFPADTNDFSWLARIMYTGGYPEVLGRKTDRISAWFKSYITAIIQRDVKAISNISDITALYTLLEMLARRCGNLLNVLDVSRLSSIKNTTLQRYLTLLERVFIICINRPWHKSVDARLVKTPKVYMNDSGLLCYLLGVSLNDLISKKSDFTGAILENFIFNELQKQISWSNSCPEIYHFRNINGKEVDFILELRNQKKIGIEVKASSTVTNSDFEGLREFSRITKDDFFRGIVLYNGSNLLQFGENLFAVPIMSMFHG